MMSQMRRSYSKKKKLLIYLFYMEKRIRLISTSVKLQVVKTLKEFYNIPLKDAKDIVDSIPTTLPLVDENWKLKSLEKQLLSLGCKIEVLNANNTSIHNNIENVNPVNHADELKSSTPADTSSDTVHDIVTDFYNSMWIWYSANGLDCISGKDLDDSTRAILRKNFEIGLEETILFKRDTSFWSSNNQGLVITEKALYCIPDNDDLSSRFVLSWKEFDNVRYKELCFYFYKGEEQVCRLNKDYFFKGTEIKISALGPHLAEALTQIAQLAEPDIDPLDLVNEGKFEEALEIADSNLKSDPQNSYNHFAKARAIYVKECQKENIEDLDEQLLELALKELQKAGELTGTEDAGALSLISLNIGYVNQVLGRAYQARNAFVEALDGCDNDDKEHIMQELVDSEDILKETWDNYTTTYDYKERKFIMPVKDYEIGGCVVDGIDVFRTSNIPSCFKFPTGHPVANQLYIGHPYNPSLYVPFEESEDIFFVDKVHELCYLLECLGAEEINITSIKGKNVSEFNDSQGSYSGSADVKLVSGEGSSSMQSRHQGEMTINNQRTMRIKLDPMRKPFLPEGLIWYDEQPQWQRLVNSRINGNMLEYNEFVSTSQTKFTSNQEKKDIKASAKYLWTKVHAEVEQNIETQFKETTETQWKVDVKFRSIKDFANMVDQNPQIASQEPKQISSSQLSEDELSYAEEVKFCLEDGAIGEKERRFLERMRTKLGISPERAAEIEESLQKPQLTEEEQEYLDAVYDEIVNGAIPESARRLLDRLRRSMDISEERAKEIEKLALN
jgi:hypothetical protein